MRAGSVNTAMCLLGRPHRTVAHVAPTVSEAKQIEQWRSLVVQNPTNWQMASPAAAKVEQACHRLGGGVWIIETETVSY